MVVQGYSYVLKRLLIIELILLTAFSSAISFIIILMSALALVFVLHIDFFSVSEFFLLYAAFVAIITRVISISIRTGRREERIIWPPEMKIIEEDLLRACEQGESISVRNICEAHGLKLNEVRRYIEHIIQEGRIQGIFSKDGNFFLPKEYIKRHVESLLKEEPSTPLTDVSEQLGVELYDLTRVLVDIVKSRDLEMYLRKYD